MGSLESLKKLILGNEEVLKKQVLASRVGPRLSVMRIYTRSGEYQPWNSVSGKGDNYDNGRWIISWMAFELTLQNKET